MSNRSIDAREEPAAVPSLPLLTSSEEMTHRVMSIMKEAFGSLPEAFWGLSRSADLVAPRGYCLNKEECFNTYRRYIDVGGGYPIVKITIDWWNWKLVDRIIIIPGIKIVTLGRRRRMGGVLVLCEGVEEVYLGENTCFGSQIELPAGLRKLVINGDYDSPLTLPPSLKELSFSKFSDFNHLITLPEKLRVAEFGDNFDKSFSLPPHIEVLRLGDGFDQPLDLSASSKLRIVRLGRGFTQPLILPPSLKRIELHRSYSLPLELPLGCHRYTSND